MLRTASALALIGLCAAVAGCADYNKREFGVQRGAQDQTRVATPPPLSLPPVLTERNLATSGGPPPAPSSATAGGVRSPPASSGEGALLQAAGPSAPGDIRSRVDQDAQLGRADPSLSNALLYGQSAQQQLIQRNSKSWLDRIF